MDDPRTIAVLGGSGDVGARVVDLLLAQDPDTEVLVVGRRLEPARRVAARSPRCRAVTADATDPASWAPLLDAHGVVSTVEPPGVDLATACIERGRDWVDLTATPARITALLALDELARAHGARVRVGVGVAPGLTGLLAAQVLASAPEADEVWVTTRLHLLDDHGPAAASWSADALRPSEGPRPDPAAAAADFADRVLLARQHPGVTTRTFLHMDPTIVGRTMAMAAARANTRRMVRWLVDGPAGGLSERLPRRARPFSVTVEARRHRQRIQRARLIGRGQSRTTAAVGVLALPGADDTAGAHALEETTDLATIRSGLSALGIVVTLDKD